jgi:hypothetical protein
MSARNVEMVTVFLAFVTVAHMLVLEKPVKGSPESTLADIPSSLPVVSADESSPYSVSPLSSSKRMKFEILILGYWSWWRVEVVQSPMEGWRGQIKVVDCCA